MTKNMLSVNAKGILFAIAAAALNGTIGVFSKFLMAAGLTPTAVAFLKSVIGFAVLLLAVPGRIESGRAYLQGAICSFFGVFLLFYFETAAYHYEIAANVVLTLMATAAIVAFVLGHFVLGDRTTLARWIGLLICMVGLAVFLGVSKPSHLVGLAYAAVAGGGYGAFLVIAKSLKLGSGLAVTRRLLLFGGLYLALPFFKEGAALPAFSFPIWLGLLALALLPSIGGFYCTTRAIELATPAQVQLFELSEPLFATLLTLVFLHEIPGMNTYLGGALVLIGLFVSQQEFGKKVKVEAAT
jgi:DME family drug/metabolite transporter